MSAPRRIVSLAVTERGELFVVADDGTAWRRESFPSRERPPWRQLPALPDREPAPELAREPYPPIVKPAPRCRKCSGAGTVLLPNRLRVACPRCDGTRVECGGGDGRVADVAAYLRGKLADTGADVVLMA